MKHHIYTQVNIEADSTIVWDILTTIEAYPNWNPFITSLEGKLEVGAQLKADIGAFKFKPSVKVVEVGRKLSWLGRFLLPGLFDGQHTFECIPQQDGSTLFIQKEDFKGILVPFLKKKLDHETKDGFEAMNLKLKALAENRASK